MAPVKLSVQAVYLTLMSLVPGGITYYIFKPEGYDDPEVLQKTIRSKYAGEIAMAKTRNAQISHMLLHPDDPEVNAKAEAVMRGGSRSSR